MDFQPNLEQDTPFLQAGLSSLRWGCAGANQRVKELGYASWYWPATSQRLPLKSRGYEGKTAEGILQFLFTKRIADPHNKSLSPKGRGSFLSAPTGHYYPEARCLVLNLKKEEAILNTIAVVTAGTSDVPVAEEAAVTAENLWPFGRSMMGSRPSPLQSLRKRSKKLVWSSWLPVWKELLSVS